MHGVQAGNSARRCRAAWTGACLLSFIVASQIAGMSQAGAGWTNSSAVSGTGDFFGVAADGTTTIGVGDDSTNSSGQISTASGSGTWSVEAAYTGNGVSMSDPNIVTNSLYSVSCTSTSFCAAVGGSGDEYTYNGTIWSAANDIDGTKTLVSVSCTTNGGTLCITVDSNGNYVSYTGSWGSPAAVTGAASFNSVSCNSTIFCWAVDSAGNAFEYTGSWGSATSVDGSTSITAISCNSSTLCVAVDGKGNYAAYYSSTWHAAASTGDSNALEAISCADSSDCMAVDAAGGARTCSTCSTSPTWAATNATGVTDAIDGVSCTSSTSCTAVDASGNQLTFASPNWTHSSIDANTALNGVSCFSASFCAAVDAKGAGLVYSTSSWQQFASVDSSGFAAVSCGGSGSTACVAVGKSGTAYAYSSTGNSWSATGSTGVTDTLNAISCPATNFCGAVDTSANYIYFNGSVWGSKTSMGSYASYSVACETTPYCVVGQAADGLAESNNPTAASPTFGYSYITPNNILDGMSCYSTTLCVAVDTGGNESYDITPTTGWSHTNYSDVDGSTSLNAVSCWSGTQCIAVDATGHALDCTSCNSSFAFTTTSVAASLANVSLTGVSCTATPTCWAVAANGYAAECTSLANCATTPSWNTPIDIAGSLDLTGVSCTSTFCAAVDSSGNAYVDTGSAAWSAPASLSASSPSINSVFCVSQSFCMAVGASGKAYDCTSSTNCSNDTWAATGSTGTTNNLVGVSCYSTTQCVAVDSTHDATVTSNGGSTWTYSSGLDPSYDFTGVSCMTYPTSIPMCVAVDADGQYDDYNFNTSSWSGMTSSGTTGDPVNSMYAISCTPSSNYCMTINAAGKGVFCYGTTVSGGPPSTHNSCDGGTSWVAYSTGDANQLTAVSVINSTNSVAVDAAGNYLTWTGGSVNTWTNEGTIGTSKSVTSISCQTTGSTVYCAAVDTSGNAYSCTGTPSSTTSAWTCSWSAAPGNPLGTTSFNSISCVVTTSPNTACAAVDASGNEYTTNTSTAAQTGPMYSVSCGAVGSCVAVGFNSSMNGAQILYSTNPTRATSWTTVTSGNMPSGISVLFSVACPSASVCFAVGTNSSGGVIITSTNGGSTWAQQTTPSNLGTVAGLYGVTCLSTTQCFAVGRGVPTGGSTEGVIIYTANGGSTWTEETYPSVSGLLTGIACTTASPPACVATGNGGGTTQTLVDVNINTSLTTWQQGNISFSGNSYLYSAACVPSTYTCYVTGWWTTTSPVTGGVIIKNSNVSSSPTTGWSTVVSPSAGGPYTFWSMTCPTATCTAAGDTTKGISASGS